MKIANPLKICTPQMQPHPVVDLGYLNPWPNFVSGSLNTVRKKLEFGGRYVQTCQIRFHKLWIFRAVYNKTWVIFHLCLVNAMGINLNELFAYIVKIYKQVSYILKWTLFNWQNHSTSAIKPSHTVVRNKFYFVCVMCNYLWQTPLFQPHFASGSRPWLEVNSPLLC